MKGCLIAAAVMFVGCLGISALSYMFGMGSQQQQGEDLGFNAPHPPPMGQMAYPAPSPTPQPVMEDEPEPQPAIEPGCYVSEAIVEAVTGDNGQREPWEFVGLVSRSDTACPSGRQSAPNAQARELAASWPFPEELLRVENSSPSQEAEEPGTFRKTVTVHTRAGETAH